MTMTTVFLFAAASLLRLAIYYGYPSLVEGSAGDTSRAVSAFGAYDVIVFGDGLELPPAGTDAGLDAERRRLPSIIAALHATSRNPRIYGYIDLGNSQALPQSEIDRRVDLWQRLGVDGIFYDEAGADFGVTPDRLRAALRAVHARGLSAFLNAFNPDDLFAGDAAPAGRLRQADQVGPNDMILVESFAVRNGVREDAQRTAARAAAALKWRDRVGVKILATTTAGAAGYDAGLFAHGRGMAESVGMNGFGWGEPDFSANSRLPDRAR
jgi:hypothetical protein